jgi:hypothetical protein
MFDVTFQAIVAALIVQGIKTIFKGQVADTYARLIALGVGGLFFVANGAVVLWVAPGDRAQIQQLVDAVKTMLALFAPAGLYDFYKQLLTSLHV